MFHETISSISGAEGLQMSHVSQVADAGLPALPETSYKLLAPNPVSYGLCPPHRGCCLPLPCKKGAESFLRDTTPLRVSNKPPRPQHSFARDGDRASVTASSLLPTSLLSMPDKTHPLTRTNFHEFFLRSSI